MLESVFAGILRRIIRTFRSDVESRTRFVRTMPTPVTPRAVAPQLYPDVVRARRQVWAASTMFLRGQARAHGVDESWIPPVPRYSQDALDTVARNAGNSWDIFFADLERAVRASARQTINDAVTQAPDSVPLVDHALDDLEEDADDFAHATGEEIRREVERHEERRRHRTAGQSLVDALDEALDRVRQADEILDDADLTPGRGGRAYEDVPRRFRTDREGRTIARPFAWARVTHPGAHGPCGFCEILAARGPVYSSSYAAGLRADAFHRYCACTVVPVFTSRAWQGKRAQEKAAARYNEVVKGSGLSGRDAVREMDRAMRESRATTEES